MDRQRPNSKIVRKADVSIETYVDGAGPAIVILPSYGRDGGADFDYFADRLTAAGFKTLRPQPRGIAGSTGTLTGVSLREQAADVAHVIQELAAEGAFLLGHAFGHVIASIVAIDFPQLTKGVIFAAAGASYARKYIGETPFIAGDTGAPLESRLAALSAGFFAPSHDPRPWLDGWYPETLKMQRDAVHTGDVKKFSSAGEGPLLEIIAESDPFKPYDLWFELREACGSRVTTRVITNASHALFPEQPEAVADVVIDWVRKLLA